MNKVPDALYKSFWKDKIFPVNFLNDISERDGNLDEVMFLVRLCLICETTQLFDTVLEFIRKNGK